MQVGFTRVSAFRLRPVAKMSRTRTPQHPIKCSASLNDTMIHSSYIIGKGMILWVMFTSGINYFVYKDIGDKNKKKDE